VSVKKSESPPITTDSMPTAPVRWPGLSYGVLPLTIMILVVIACLIAYSLATANVESSRAATIARRLDENSLRFSSVFDSYAHISWGSTGRAESGDLDSDSWQRFISVYNISKNFSGMEAIGLSYGNSPTSNIITYVSPPNDLTRGSIGYDTGTMPVLKSAMERAVRDGQTIISDAMPRLFSTKKDDTSRKPGFLMFTPFFDTSLPQSNPDERARAVRGFTIAMFRGDSFLEQIFKRRDLSHTSVKVYLGDVKPANLLYTAGQTTDSDVRIVKQELTEYGKTFTVLYTMDTAYILVWLTTYFPQFLLVGGILFGLLFAVISGYLLRNRFFRLVYEKERDVEFAKDELLSLASHQLRTPATGVKQYLGMVLQGFAGDISQKQRDYLQRAYASNNRQLSVINDILHLAKLETGRIVLAERKFDITKMVRDVIDEQRESAEKAEVKLVLEAPSQGSIMGDSHMLRMVIENLVSNGIKYTPPGGVVTVRITRRTNRWVIMVKDTGVGISKSDFPKLFKQFSRINNPRSEFVTGTGVGLYLSYHLTVLHGGMISVTSRKGKGSTFTVRLPRKI
jgi:signal transduction histidine kinase